MNAHDVLAELRQRGVELIAAGDRLRYRPKAAVSPDLLDGLRRCKPELLAILSNRRVPHELSLAEKVQNGFVPDGWQPKCWATRLQSLAAKCQADHPDAARQYHVWADAIDRRYAPLVYVAHRGPLPTALPVADGEIRQAARQAVGMERDK